MEKTGTLRRCKTKYKDMEFKEQIRQIKSDFFSLRNGEIADTLRKAGNPYKIIFGLQMPQLEQIAAKSGKSVELAEWMWANDSTRESKMFATMVYPIEEFDLAKAEEWALEAETFELIDIFCFRLVRYINGSEELVHKYMESAEEKMRYFAYRLAMNLLILRKISNTDDLYSAAKKEVDSSQTMALKRIANQIVQEVEFMLE